MKAWIRKDLTQSIFNKLDSIINPPHYIPSRNLRVDEHGQIYLLEDTLTLDTSKRKFMEEEE